MGGTNGMNNVLAQQDRFRRLTEYIRDLSEVYKDHTVLGDINIDDRRIHDTTYKRSLVEILEDFKNTTGMRQIIEKETRIQVVNNELRSSLIDHVYTRQPELFLYKKVEQICTSDHLGIWLKKVSKLPKYFPKCNIRRSLKNLNV